MHQHGMASTRQTRRLLQAKKVLKPAAEHRLFAAVINAPISATGQGPTQRGQRIELAAGTPIQTIQQGPLQINGLQLRRAAYTLQVRTKPQVQLGEQAYVIHRRPQLRLQLMQKSQPSAQLQLCWRPAKPLQAAALQLRGAQGATLRGLVCGCWS